jgi:molecular chaperone DnaK
VQIAEEFIAEKAGQPLHLKATVTRREFEELIEPYIDRTIQSVDEALRGAKLTIHQIDDLVLVGGSTRIPLVEERLRNEFQREPSRAVDPDLAVALGAAVQAAMIDGRSAGPVLVDVTGHTMGVEACVGMSFQGPEMVFSPIIHRNSPLPARYEEAYSKMYDDQEMVVIHVLQGERPEVHRNRSIGKFRLPLESGGGDRNKIVVRFDLTLDGTLKVTATQPATGLSRELIIDNALSQFQADSRSRAEERLEALFHGAEELLDEEDIPALKEWKTGDFDSDADAPAAGTAPRPSSKFHEAFALLKKAEALKPSLEGQDARDLESICNNLGDAMAADDAAVVAALGAELEDLLFYVG